MSLLDPNLAGRVGVEAVDSYRRLADIYHHLLSEQSLDALLEMIADALVDLLPYDTLTIYEADHVNSVLVPMLARDTWAEQIMTSRPAFGRGITGWAVEHRQAVLANEAHLDVRVDFVPGTPLEPEALISVPLIARGAVKGALNIYRQGGSVFDETEFMLAKRFADAAALALDNARIREALEHQAQTDPLTGLYNHRYFQERLRSELVRASRAHDSAAVILFDIDDFKKLNDVHGHAAGDQVLQCVADIMRSTVRASDVPCRVGGEEFAIILPSCEAGDAMGLARRLRDRLAVADTGPAGTVTVSIGIAQGPEHAMNPRDLVACAEAAMMSAKARGKDRSLLFDESTTDRPDGMTRSDVRSIAHMKMLQSLSGKLNRLNDVRQIASSIASELKSLIDYHNCRVYLAQGNDLLPIACHGTFNSETGDLTIGATHFGVGITGRAAATGDPVLVPNALECDFAVLLPGTEEIEESIVAVPMLYGPRVNGVITISKLGEDQFDQEDVRLLEVLAGQASVALENARLYEAQRREAKNARELLEFSDTVSTAQSMHAIGNRTVDEFVRLLDVDQSAMWLLNERSGRYECVAHHGYVNDAIMRDLIKRTVSAEDARKLMQGRRQPFLITPEAIRRDFPDNDVDDDVLRTLAIAPMPSDVGIDGWVVARQPSDVGLFFTEDRLRLMAGLAYQASVAMQKVQLYRNQKETADIANALLDFSRKLASSEDIDTILKRTAEQAGSILGSPKTIVWLQEPETGCLLPEAVSGFNDEERRQLVDITFPEELVGMLELANEPFVIWPGDHLDEDGEVTGALTSAVAPLKLEGGRLGCIAATAPALGDYEFSERKMRLLEGIADQAKLALNNANNFETLETTFLSTVEALANALEAKDEYTSSHTRSIVDMSLEVGAAMGMDAKELKTLEMGALFHDIGKIGIPSQILLKPGPLTDEERTIMQTHPELGERILAPIERLEAVRRVVRHCHEHFDGSGYPDGLAGEDIPIESRIILVCDAFDAMTTDRPYRARLSIEEACRRLRESSGSQFDPKIVDLFLRLLDEAVA